MKDLTSAPAYYHQSMIMTAKQQQPELPEQEHLNCPRCDSPNTKFCYYNNYNLSQPRHFCKNCRRYWTKGGSLRKIPVGGGSRKNSKRSGSSSTSSDLKINAPDQKLSSGSDSRDFGSGSGSKLEEEEKVKENSGQELDPTRMLYGLPVGDPISGSFISLLASNMQLGRALCETGSRWYPVTDLGLGSDSDMGLWRSECDDALAKKKVEDN